MRRAWSATLALATIAVLVTACGGDDSPSASSGSTSTTSAPTSTTLGREGAFGVGIEQRTFVDRSRATPAENGHPGASTRTLPTAIFYPTNEPGSGAYGADAVPDAPPARESGPFPVVVWAHGLTGDGAGDLDEFEAWIQAGYVVIAPTFPITSGATANFDSLADLANQPGDMSFVLTEVLEIVSEPSSPLHDVLDSRHIGAAGHSAGAATVLAFYDKQYADSRFRVVYESSGGALISPGVLFDGITAPLLAAHGTDDDTLGYDGDLQLWQRAPAPKFFLTLVGEGHNTPFFPPVGQPPTELNLLVDDVAVGFFDAYLKDDTSGVTRMEQAGNSPGVATLMVDTGGTGAR